MCFQSRLPVRAALCSMVCVAGCLPGAPLDPPESPVELVSIEPAENVPGDAEVAVRLSRPVRPGEVDLGVEDLGRPIPHDTRIDPDAPLAWIRSRVSWPEGTVIAVRLLYPDGEIGPPLSFRTEASPVRRIFVSAPVPGRRAAPNTRRIALAGAAPTAVILRSGGSAVKAEAIEPFGAGWLAILPERAGECPPLCPGRTYALEVEPEEVQGVGAIQTSTQADSGPPNAEIEVAVAPRELRVAYRADEASLVTAEAASPGAGPISLTSAVFTGAPVELIAAEGVLPDTTYRVVVSAEDLAGNAIAPRAFVLRTPPEVEIELSELVASPIHDWNDSDGSGEPFDATPGQGTVSDADEWIELVNRSPGPIDLSASRLSLKTIDGTPSETAVSSAPTLRFGGGGTPHAWWPGEALVVRTRGAMSQRGLVVELWAANQLVDRVELSSEPGADHGGGSPPDVDHEAIARDASGAWRWCRPTPGDPLPATDCL